MEILRPAPFIIRPSKSRKCTCGSTNCKRAKKILCTCKCHSLHHGEANRVGMEPLDKTLGLDGLTVTATKEGELVYTDDPPPRPKPALVPWFEIC